MSREVPRRILIVEDSRTQAEALHALLEAASYTVFVAHTAEDALLQLQTLRVDLVLSDVMMPGMSGYDLTRSVHRNPATREIPVVLLTSLGDPLDIVRGLEAGANNFITKPYEEAHLLSRLRHIFDNRSRRARSSGGVTITFRGQQFDIMADKEQILDLLVSSLDDLIRTNEALRESEAGRAKLYESERAARMDAETANRAKTDFLTAMSHDLRTPLNAIGGYAELIEMGVRGPVTPQQLEDLARIRRNQQHLMALVGDVLGFARLERGQVSVKPRDVSAHETLLGVRAIIEPQVRAKGLVYEYERCDAGLRMRADPEKVEQILINLLTNAMKFTPTGGRIVLSCEGTEDHVVINVADTGMGIPTDRIEAIFDPFFQVDAARTSQQQHGIGLGLAISRNLAHLMDGELKVTSVLGQGSVFRLALPRA